MRRAAQAGAGMVRETPVLSSRTLSERAGGTVALKAENLQRTGSFKLRGALSKLAALGEDCAAGVVTGSAGNHAQAVAQAARAQGLPCDVFMPETAPIAKVEAARGLGAHVQMIGVTVDDALEAARERAARDDRIAFVHPFEDAHVIAGQGTLGLELLEQVPNLARAIVPVGGGGLISGVAIALKSARPEIEVLGVQVASCAPIRASLDAGKPVPVTSALTIADGIAVKRPGELTLQLIGRWVDEMAVVEEDEVAEAMAFLLERAKLVVEGAGAVGVAALLAGRLSASPTGTTVVVLSGGNVDAGLLAEVARRHESQSGRRLVLLASLPDRPGSLARLLALVGELGANLLDVGHIREGFDLHVRETAVQLVLETRGSGHAERVAGAVREAGYAEPRALR
ncbi:MAG: threonine ammonia-lyase [Solirubrobacterales bacterium]|nr:threonine ammonia-lyase [Solirubrobacterales bacterium]MBV9941120.1 threonine ammonia-lyase [Solirubrobacterales bacterium]